MQSTRLSTLLILAFLLSCCVELGKTQQRFNAEFDGRFKGFTKSSTEHIMHEYKGTPEIRKVKGRILDEFGYGMSDAVFEIRRENPEDKVRGVQTNGKGEFHIGSIQDGVYLFKATRDGFQSVYGKIRVSKTARPENKFEIVLYVGV